MDAVFGTHNVGRATGLLRQAAAEGSAIRGFLLSRGNSAIADRGFHWLMVLSALSIFGIVVLIASELVVRSQLAWSSFGLKFFFSKFVDPDTHLPMYWDPVNSHFSALPFVYGTLMSSFLALLIAVPLAIGLAVFLTEMCPRWLRTPLAFITELLAAIPSVIYGLWAVFILVPLLLIVGAAAGAYFTGLMDPLLKMFHKDKSGPAAEEQPKAGAPGYSEFGQPAA